MSVRHDSTIETLLAAIRRAADPTNAIIRALSAEPPPSSCDLLAVGKAAATVVRTALQVHTDRFGRILAVAPEATLATLPAHPSLTALPGDHPAPTKRSLHAAERTERFLSGATRPILVLLSGGGSAMLARPIEPLTLDDLRDTADHLMRAGVDIHDLNTIRAQLDHTKAGRLATRSTQSIRVLVLSDVMGDRLESIASGPFFGTPHTADDAKRILDDAHASTRDAVGQVLRDSPAPPLHPSDPRLAHVTHEFIASNSTVTTAVAGRLAATGLAPLVEQNVTGEAIDAGHRLADALVTGHSAAVLGGEPTVSDVPSGALGGPMQEAATAAALRLHQAPSAPADWAVIAYATDGVDGPTPSAGALITSRDFSPTLAQDLGRALHTHDTHRALASANLTIPGGPTGTNLNDILIALDLASA